MGVRSVAVCMGRQNPQRTFEGVIFSYLLVVGETEL